MRYALVMVLLLGGAAFPQSAGPVKFRGAYIGQPISDWVNCSTGKAKSLYGGYRPHGNICKGEKGKIFHVQVKGIMNARDEGEIFSIENQRLAEILILIPNNDWEKVRYDLTEKLGEPMSEVPTVYQNAFGARWEYDHGFWLNDTTVAFAGFRVMQGLGRPEAEGIQIKITDPEHAKLPHTTANSLD